MQTSVLFRYLDPEVLNQIATRSLEPTDLVLGTLAGAHKSPLAGFAVEFAGHREYVAGDDPKHIDWRVYFNRDKLFVKQYELETNFVCHMVLDISSSMRYGEGTQQKLLYAARMATLLGYAIVNQSDKVSLATVDQALRTFVPPGNTLDQIVRLTQHLDNVEATEKTDLGDCLKDLSARIGRREIVMIFSDFFADLETLDLAIGHLRFQQHEVVLFRTLHHDELTFSMNRAPRFVGLEDSDSLLLHPDDVRDGYLKALNDFNQQLADLADRNRCELVAVDTNQGLAEVLMDYLNKRSRHARGR